MSATSPSSSKQSPSRYSFLRLRPSNFAFAEYPSRNLKRETSDSARFFYPPLTPEYPMASTSQPSAPHPYGVAGIASPSPDPETGAGTGASGMQAAQEEVLRQSRDKEPSADTVQTYDSLVRRRTRTPSLHSPILEKYKLPILLLLFLPIPPLLSLIYILTGHAILLHAQPTKPAWGASSFLSSAGAGATGGIILSIPLALLLYLLVYPAPREDAPADFFEDDESMMRGSMVRYTSYTVCLALGVFLGAVAGPLGVTCVPAGALSAGNAAVAGLVGGVLLCGGGCVVLGIGVGVWVVAASGREQDGG